MSVQAPEQGPDEEMPTADTPGHVARYLLGDNMVIHGSREPAGTIKLRSGKCSMQGMSEDEARSLLWTATFDGWEE